MGEPLAILRLTPIIVIINRFICPRELICLSAYFNSPTWSGPVQKEKDTLLLLLAVLPATDTKVPRRCFLQDILPLFLKCTLEDTPRLFGWFSSFLLNSNLLTKMSALLSYNHTSST